MQLKKLHVVSSKLHNTPYNKVHVVLETVYKKNIQTAHIFLPRSSQKHAVSEAIWTGILQKNVTHLWTTIENIDTYIQLFIY